MNIYGKVPNRKEIARRIENYRLAGGGELDPVGSLISLEKLVITGSPLSVLPESTGNLCSLIKLYLYETQIKYTNIASLPLPLAIWKTLPVWEFTVMEMKNNGGAKVIARIGVRMRIPKKEAPLPACLIPRQNLFRLNS